MIRFLNAALFSFWGLGAFAQGLTAFDKSLFVEFAVDVSGQDEVTVAQAEWLVEVPPTTVETIGFYGLEAAAPESRALRGIIALLADRGHLLELEPAYAFYELTPLLEAEGVLGHGHGVPDILAGLPDEEWQGPELSEASIRSLHKLIADFANAVEAEMAKNDFVVMEITLPAGDAVFYWVTTPELAARWHCELLLSEAALYGPPRIEETRVQRLDWRRFDQITVRSMGVDGSLLPNPYALPQHPCSLGQV